jgi:serine/threonine protein phosphatase PrpC
MPKPNQDNFILLKDFAGIQKCWMIGVMDGHGVNGHTVSHFVKQNLPSI